jgi:ankyrin repeat protein
MESQRSFGECFELLKAGDVGGLRHIFERDSSAAEARDADGVSLLMHSLYRGHCDLAELIASRKKALDIFEAASLGRLDRLKECIRDGSGDGSATNAHALDVPSLDLPSKDGFTALHFACFFGQPEAARVLLENGAAADAVAANLMQVMPLHSAASVRNLEAARLLLEHGAPVNARQQAGWVPIHAAAQNGDRPMVELLLQRGADPTLANHEGKTPAVIAKEKGHNEIADLLDKVNLEK